MKNRREKDRNVWNAFTGHGYIPTSSLREILRELDDQLTEQELDGIVAEIDTDHSGTVDFDGRSGPYRWFFF